MSNIFSLSAGLLLTNPSRELLMIHEPDGWGIPAGKVEARDLLLPSRALRHEFAEETKATLLVPIALTGLILILRPNRLSAGFLYRATQQIPQAEFVTPVQALALISEGQVREPEYNLPALFAWITNSFIISFKAERR